MSDPYLSAIIVNDPEKDPRLLEYCFQGIRLLNDDALVDTQFIVLNQDPDGGKAYELARAQPFDVEWFDAGYECVSGVVLWDIMDSLRVVWPRLRGRYHIIMHKEWVCGPSVLRKSIDWLKKNKEPVVALANLRRVGSKKQLTANRMSSSGKRNSQRIRKVMGSEDRDAICQHLSRIRTLPWKYWADPEKRKPDTWMEDAYFGRIDWFNQMRFFSHADRLLFQDVYDLMAILFKRLAAENAAPPVPQVPLRVGKIFHLWHTKAYLHFSDRVIDYFCGNPDRWHETQFAERNTMERLRDFVQEGGVAHRNPLISFRQDRGGTAWRYRRGIDRWLRARGRTQDVQVVAEPVPTRKIKTIAVIARNSRWRNPSEPHRHVYAGLKALGYETEVLSRIPPSRSWPPWAARPDAIFIWNGENDDWREKIEELRQEGTLVFIMERGFFDRNSYTQIDHRGFGHKASWADEFFKAAPSNAARRFRDVWGSAPVPMKARADGYILVLLQVPADAQLAESEYDQPGPLVDNVAKGLRIVGKDVPIRVRAHPRCDWSCGTQGVPRMLNGELKAAVEGARFAVTINSNSGNEALAWGCPLLSYGPSMALKGKVARRTASTATGGQIRHMLDGWAPSVTEVRNYLYWLASRQWNNEELAKGTALKAIINRALCPE